jgi:hypothetical protein
VTPERRNARNAGVDLRLHRNKPVEPGVLRRTTFFPEKPELKAFWASEGVGVSRIQVLQRLMTGNFTFSRVKGIYGNQQ